MGKFLQGMIHLIIIAACGFTVWFYWSGIFPERMRSERSNSGIEVRFRITGTRTWRPEFDTLLSLNRPNGDRFVYDLQSLGSREEVERVVGSLMWMDDNTLFFKNYPKNKKVTVWYTNGLWRLIEESF